MDLVCNPSCKSDTDICWSFTIYFKYDGSFKGAHSNFFRPGRYIGVSKYDGDFSAFVLKLVAIISTRLKCQMLADYDLRKTSHKRFHLVVRRAVTTKKCAKQCAHVFF